MFVGHYGVSFVTKRADPSIPLWVLFLAVQWLDVIWAPLVLLNVEKVRIVPGFTATNPLDLYYMPYTHSLVAALLWSVVAAGAYRLMRHRTSLRISFLFGLAVFSHWVLDFIVHGPDLPLYDNTAKVGLGLWNYPAWAFGLEAGLLLGGIFAYFQRRPARRTAIIIFGLVMLSIQAYVFFGPPPASPDAAASTALAAYVIFAVVIWWLADRPAAARAV
jgi:LexA-binding, inner membrane-associated putative hydrolase